jgi:hypothetical protein
MRHTDDKHLYIHIFSCILPARKLVTQLISRTHVEGEQHHLMWVMIAVVFNHNGMPSKNQPIGIALGTGRYKYTHHGQYLWTKETCLQVYQLMCNRG